MEKNIVFKAIGVIPIILTIFTGLQVKAQLQDKYWIFGNPEPSNVPINMAIYDNFNSPLLLAGPVTITGFSTVSSGSGPGQNFDLFGGEGSAVATDP